MPGQERIAEGLPHPAINVARYALRQQCVAVIYDADE